LNPDPFRRTIACYRRSLATHRFLDAVLRVVSIGLLDNAANVGKWLELYEKAKSEQSRYIALLSEKSVDGDADTIEIAGVRVSRHTFSDIPVTGGEDYGCAWETIRDEILERDGYACQESDGYCKGPLQIHHIIPLSNGGSNLRENLLTLCLYHHSLKHNHMRNRLHGNIWS